MRWFLCGRSRCPVDVLDYILSAKGKRCERIRVVNKNINNETLTLDSDVSKKRVLPNASVDI